VNKVRLIFPSVEEQWLLIEADSIIARGEQASALAPANDETRLLIAPASDVSLHALDLPDLAPAQACAAARLALSEKSLLLPDQLHVACSFHSEAEARRTVAMIARDKMEAWIDRFDPDVILPSPLLLPRSDEGYVRAVFEQETVLRGDGVGFAEDAALTPLIIGNTPIFTLDKAGLEKALVAAAHNPALNLREGDFARRRQWRFEANWIRRIALIGLALLLVTLLIPLTQIARLSLASRTLEETSASLAQAALGEAVASETAISALDTRLAAQRGGGAGFAKTAAAASRAIEATANVELTTMVFDPDGTLRLTLRAATADEIRLVQARMRAAGLDVISGPINPSQGQPIVETKVRGR
jgi:general secretion pathway protein L